MLHKKGFRCCSD